MKASSSDGNEQLDSNSARPTSNTGNFMLSSELTPKSVEIKMLLDETGSRKPAKINLQHLPLNTTSIVKNIQGATLTSPVSNTSISSIYNLMLSQQQQNQQQSIVSGLKPAVLSQPNLPIVTMMSSLNGSAGSGGGNAKAGNKIVITNQASGANGSHASARIITTTQTPATGDNLPKSMPSSLKSSIITTTTNQSTAPGNHQSSINLKSMSPLSFDAKTNLIKTSSIKPAQTQTVQLINNLVNFSTPSMIPVAQPGPYHKQHKLPPPAHTSLTIPQLINTSQGRPANVVGVIDTSGLPDLTPTHNSVSSPSASPLKPNIIRKSRY